mgnify:CR=1 FL=1
MNLTEYLRAARGRPFRYGRWDCALFSAGWVLEHTGRDLTLGIKYTSLREGREKLTAAGFADHIAVAASQLLEIPVAQARAGDVAEVEGALGIVAGERVAVLARGGVGYVPLLSARRAFRVGAE